MPSVLIKTSDSCNLACSYCYATTRTAKISQDNFLSLDTTKRIFQETTNFFGNVKNINYIWHGGEPLLLGLDYFKNIVERQRYYKETGFKLTNSIQTNGILIDENWAKFFYDSDFSVGVSIDGLPDLHNKVRKFPNHENSYYRVLEGIKCLKSENVKLGGLCVITNQSVLFSKEILENFVNLGIKKIDFLPFVDFDNNDQTTSLSLAPKELYDFLGSAFDYWFKLDDPDFEIRIFENIILGLLGEKISLCSFNGNCNQFISINANGDVYHCDFFVGNNSFCFGNIMNDSLGFILTGARYIEYQEIVTHLPKMCGHCKWKKICNGGCTYHRWIRNKNFSDKYYFCESRKLLFDHIQSTINQYT